MLPPWAGGSTSVWMQGRTLLTNKDSLGSRHIPVPQRLQHAHRHYTLHVLLFPPLASFSFHHQVPFTLPHTTLLFTPDPPPHSPFPGTFAPTSTDSDTEQQQQQEAPKLQTVMLDVSGMMCGGCSAAVKNILLQQPGVQGAAVNLITHAAAVTVK